MKSVLIILMLLLGSGSFTVSRSQQSPPFPPYVSMTGALRGWNTYAYPDGRIHARRSDTSEASLLRVPVFVRNCWRALSWAPTFPITSLTVPVQFDSGAVEFVDVEPASHGGNFEFAATAVRADTTYMSVINARPDRRSRGMRVTISGEAVVDSLHLTPDAGAVDYPCEQRPFEPLFTLIFRVTASDSISLITPVIIPQDSLAYNGYHVLDATWGLSDLPNDPWRGLAGIDNAFLDASGGIQYRDPLRPSRRGMIWLEIHENIGEISFGGVDTVRITVPYDYQLKDTTDGIGYADVDISNVVPVSRINDISVVNPAPWLMMRTDAYDTIGVINPMPVRTDSGAIWYLDNGILGTTATVTPFGDFMPAQKPVRLRIFGKPVVGSGEAYVSTISFTSTSMATSPVELPVVFEIEEKPTSVADERGIETAPTVSVHPNPSTGGVTISVSTDAPYSVEVISMTGHDVATFEAVEIAPDHPLSLQGLSSGVYQVVVRSANGIRSVPLVVVP